MADTPFSAPALADAFFLLWEAQRELAQGQRALAIALLSDSADAPEERLKQMQDLQRRLNIVDERADRFLDFARALRDAD